MPSPRRARADATDGDDRLSLTAGPAGAVTGVGLGLGLAGFAAVGPPLAIPGCALVALGVLSLLSTYLVATGVHVHGRMLKTTVTEGETLRLELSVSGHRLLGLVGATLEHPLLSEPYALAHATDGLFGLAQLRAQLRGAPWRLPVTGRARRRGRLLIAPPTVCFSDALGLVHAERRSAGSMGELLVLPRIEPVHWGDKDLSGASAHIRTTVPGNEATDLAGLRDYQLGTPATRIYWPALARGGTLLERYFEGEVEIVPLIVLDARGAGTREDASRLDTVIRAVASLTVELGRGAAVDLLLPGGTAPLRIGAGLGAWPAVHRALAVVAEQPATAAPPLIPDDRAGLLFYACVYPTLSLIAQRHWAGRVLLLTPRDVGTPAVSPVLDVAGCVATPPGSV